jgi:hypothetical protein
VGLFDGAVLDPVFAYTKEGSIEAYIDRSIPTAISTCRVETLTPVVQFRQYRNIIMNRSTNMIPGASEMLCLSHDSCFGLKLQQNKKRRRIGRPRF